MRMASLLLVGVILAATGPGPSQALTNLDGLVLASADPVAIKEPGGKVTYSVRITNTSPDLDLAVTSVVDNVFGDLGDEGGSGCFDVPINLAPGQFTNCQFTEQITGTGGVDHVSFVTVSGTNENGDPVSHSTEVRIEIIPRLIDLVLVKSATSPTPLNGVVRYTITATNRGPDTATNVQLADPAPFGITYLEANPRQGRCTLTQSASLVTCGLGSIPPDATVAVGVVGRAGEVGRLLNTATVTGGGGRETNPADNVDDASTVVPQPLLPPTPALCLELTVSPKTVKADGRIDKVVVKVTIGNTRVRGARVLVTGAGIRKTARSNANGIALLLVNPRKAGLLTVSTIKTRRPICGPKRVGVVGVFLPPAQPARLGWAVQPTRLELRPHFGRGSGRRAHPRRFVPGRRAAGDAPS